MSAIEFIEKLQKKPRYVRVRIMWAAVAVCMIFVFVFWICLLKKNLEKQTVQIASKEEIPNAINQLKEDLPTLWQSLSAGIGSVFQSIKQGSGSQSETNLSDSNNQVTNEGAREKRLPIE